MESLRGPASLRNPGKQPYLPPKSPFPSTVAQAYGDHGLTGSRAVPKRDGPRQHQRTSSESFLIEEQPLWLDDLLNEPETPVKRAVHRRSSSDSFAYLDGARICSNFNNLDQEECRQRTIAPIPLWGSQEFEHFKNVQPYFAEESSFGGPRNRVWLPGLNAGSYSNSLPFVMEKGLHPESSSVALKGNEALASRFNENLEKEESLIDSKGLLEKKDVSLANNIQLEADSKRVKQQFAQRSRVRKLQYIAELERNVQALQAEGLEVSAELDFVDQQNLILSLENKALKQRLDSLAQEKLIKHLQHEMLEREIARLRVLFQHQQQQSPLHPPLPHGRSSSSSISDLDSQFANISLKHKVVNSGRDPITGLRI